jgi:hypothetical protein
MALSPTIARALRDQYPEEADQIIEILNRSPKKGRPAGTAKFEEIDHTFVALANLYARDHPGVSVKAAVAAVVGDAWNRFPDRHAEIGLSPEAASARVFQRLRADDSWYALTYPIARQVKKRVRKRPELK